ncbi:bacterio-opsin activator domain-containing protein [Haladaptatus salinisoli]|uniref:helix-turn-helix domain-containing protein n=1 Tax=Haladaptatus salinisoli TaxID=2884876 RepID=UPI001D0AA031|nr:helix-turn-helix domain-containing protein [Haladaptatus salinisoli]
MTGTVVEVEVPADEFALSQTLSAVADSEFEIERVVAHDAEMMMPFVWVSGGEREAIETALSEDPSVSEFELLANPNEEWFYRMEWVDQIETLVRILVEEEGTILAATGNSDHWNLRILFPDRDSLSRTYDYCEENGLALDILNIYRLEEGRQGRFGLTQEQQDALTLAYDEGYYDIPRNLDAGDLAEELGITHQAVSERLRRAHENLVKNTLIIGRGPDEKGK